MNGPITTKKGKLFFKVENGSDLIGNQRNECKHNIILYLSNCHFIFGIKCSVVSSVDKC